MPHKTIYVGGEKLPSVTERLGIINKPALLAWYRRLGFDEADKVRDNSAEAGSNVHDQIERWIKTGNDVSGGSLVLTEFRKWYGWRSPEPLLVEPDNPLECRKYWFQGTPDFIGRVEGRVQPDGPLHDAERKQKPGGLGSGAQRIAVADWKTGKSVWPEQYLQLSAYAYLYGKSQGWTEKETFEKIPSALILKLNEKYLPFKYVTDKAGAVTCSNEVWVHNLAKYFKVFKSVIKVHDYCNGIGKWAKA